MESPAFPELPDRLAVMLQRQRELQENYMLNGNSFASMSLLDRTRYLRDMVLAIDNELHSEVMHEFSWKPWSSELPRVHADHLFRELVDVWHFLMNMMWATYPTDTPAELARRLFLVYTDKQQVNVVRQQTGYANGGKCPLCQRALDDVGYSHSNDTPLIVLCHGCRGTFRVQDAKT